MHQSSLIYLHTQLKLNIMERKELLEIFEEMKNSSGNERITNLLILSMSNNQLEKSLRIIDRALELKLFLKKEIEKLPF